MRRRELLQATGIWAASAALPSAAWAFRPSTKWVLEQAVGVRYRLGIRSLAITADVRRTDTGADAHDGQERTWVMSPSSLRRETTRPDGQDLLLVTKKKQHIEYGASKQSKKRRPDFITDFFTMGEPMARIEASKRLFAALKAMGVDDKVVSYGRHDGRVMYVLGAKAFEDDKPSIWIDKKSLQLSRLVSVKKTADGKTSRVDTKLLGYGSPEGGAWWPKTWEVHADGKLVKQATIRSVEKNVTVDKGRFALPK